MAVESLTDQQISGFQTGVRGPPVAELAPCRTHGGGQIYSSGSSWPSV